MSACGAPKPAAASPCIAPTIVPIPCPAPPPSPCSAPTIVQIPCPAPPPSPCYAASAAVPDLPKAIVSKCIPCALPPQKPMPAVIPAALSPFPTGYGYVVLTAIGSVMLLTWKAIKVGQARAEHKVPYPAMYSADNIAFNCVQRAHQNTLENYPQFLLLLLIGGLEMPIFTTLGGLIWIAGRVAYAKGYYTGDPRKRARGTFGIAGMIMMGLATTRFALRYLW